MTTPSPLILLLLASIPPTSWSSLTERNHLIWVLGFRERKRRDVGQNQKMWIVDEGDFERTRMGIWGFTVLGFGSSERGREINWERDREPLTSKYGFFCFFLSSASSLLQSSDRPREWTPLPQSRVLLPWVILYTRTKTTDTPPLLSSPTIKI